MRALISTYDKTGLDDFARGLAELGWELVASGGTAAQLEELGLTVEHVEALTNFPEMLGGRVKTLHPRIHAGILARRDNDGDVATLAEHGIAPFDLVCINLYPFEQVSAQRGITEMDAVEMIDVGGPSMLRGAAKNFAHVAPVCRPERYGFVLDELRRNGVLSLETRRELAAEAFATSAAYEAAIATWFSERETFPDTHVIALEKVLDLSYGENPHQRAAYYAERGARRHLLSRVEQLHGKALSFNNLNDLSAARLLAREFTLPACVIVKHANPCGVGVGATLEEAYDKALASDPTSAYGGIVVVNREVDAALGEKLAEQFVEVLLAPGYADDGARRAAAKTEHPHPRRPRAAAGRRLAPLQARARRPPRPGPRHGHRGPRRLAGRRRRADREDVGRSRFRLARLQARLLECDRAREGSPDDRDRRRSDEPCRRREHRRRQGPRARTRPPRRRPRLGRVLPVSRRTGESPSPRGSRRSSSRAARGATRT